MVVKPQNIPQTPNSLLLWDYQLPKMDIAPPNMHQPSNSLLSPNKSMVARGNQGHTMMEVLRLSTTQNGFSTSTYASNLKFCIITH